MSERKNAVLITGIAGAIGQATAILLNGENHEIAGLDTAELPASLEEMVKTHELGSITDTALLERALGDADTVVHLAGWVHVVPRNEEENRKVFEINHKATREIARLCRESDKKLVFASTVAVYGDESSGRLSEESPTSPSTAYAQSKLLAEKHVLDAGGTVLRLPMVYGARDRGNMARMIKAIKKGWFVVPGKGAALRTFVGRWNVAEAVLYALRSSVSAGKIYLVTDNEDVRLWDLCNTIARLCGCRRPWRIPSVVVGAGALAGSAFEVVLRRNMPLSRPSYRKLTRDLAFDGSKIRNELGYKPIKTLEEGLKEEIDWLLAEEADR